jgi:hypothetical protein
LDRINNNSGALFGLIRLRPSVADRIWIRWEYEGLELWLGDVETPLAY